MQQQVRGDGGATPRRRIRSRWSASPVCWVPLLLALGYATTGDATSVRSVSVPEMLAASDLVFEGRVSSVEARPGATRHSIRTCAVFEVVDVIKGDAQPGQLELCFAGGTLDGFSQRIGGMEYPEVGDVGVYFVESPERLQVHPLYGWEQGHFRIESTGPAPIVTTADHVPVLAIEGGPVSETGISGGAASGLVLGDERVDPASARTSSGSGTSSGPAGPSAATALSPEEFKAALRGVMLDAATK